MRQNFDSQSQYIYVPRLPSTHDVPWSTQISNIHIDIWYSPLKVLLLQSIQNPRNRYIKNGVDHKINLPMQKKIIEFTHLKNVIPFGLPGFFLSNQDSYPSFRFLYVGFILRKQRKVIIGWSFIAIKQFNYSDI